MKYYINLFIKYICFILFILLIPAITFSQINISGVVVDAKNNIPLKWAVVNANLSTDSSIVSATETADNGVFTLINLNPGEYNLYFSYTGYSAKVLKLNITNKTTFIDTVKLSSSEYRIDVVNIESEMPEMRLEGDKKIFSTDKMISTKGGTALDVLRKLPMLNVDINDNVKLRGSTNAIILIDNRPMHIGSLRQITANAIKTVEIITNPSAKYEAEGVTGIINIVLKENILNSYGYNSVVNASMNSNNRSNINIGFNFRVKKWSYFLNLSSSLSKYVSTHNSYVEYYEPHSSYSSSAYGESNSIYGSPSIGAEYEITKNQIIGFDSYLNTSKSDYNSFTHNYNYGISNNLSSYFTNDNINNGSGKNFGGTLYYNRKYNTAGKELIAEFAYTGSRSDRISNQNILYYDSLLQFASTNISKQISNTNYNTDYYRLQMDYSNKISNDSKFETGFRSIFRRMDNEYNSDTLNSNINSFVPDLSVTNNFRLDEYINAVYGIYSHNINKFGAKLGLRIEHTYSKGELFTSNSNFTKNYLNIFPSVSLTQKIGLSNVVTLGYSRRITRPMSYRLNPFVYKYNNKFITTGNPELNPEFTDSYELSYSFISDIVTLTPMAFYRRSYDVISNYSYLIDTNVKVSTYRNSAGARSYGIDLVLNSNGIKWWNLNSIFSLYKSKFEGDITNDYSSEEGLFWQIRITSTFSIAKIFNLDFDYYYTGKKVNVNGFIEPDQSLDITVSKSFYNDKLNVILRAEDVFNTFNYGSETNGIGVKTVNSAKWNVRSITLNVSYSFGNTDDKYKKNKKTKRNENEMQDQSDGGK